MSHGGNASNDNKPSKDTPRDKTDIDSKRTVRDIVKIFETSSDDGNQGSSEKSMGKKTEVLINPEYLLKKGVKYNSQTTIIPFDNGMVRLVTDIWVEQNDRNPIDWNGKYWFFENDN